MNKWISILFTCWIGSLYLHGQSPIFSGNFGGTYSDWGNDVTCDAAGSVYSIGFFQDTADFDPGPGTFLKCSEGYNDVFIAKQDSLGNLQWVFTLSDTSDSDRGKEAEVDPAGNLVVCALFYGAADADPGPGTFTLTAPNGGAIIAKYSSLGQLIWAKTYGPANVNSMVIDDDGNIYTTGPFSGTADFDPGPGTVNLTAPSTGNAYVAKFDSSGNFIWVREFRCPPGNFGVQPNDVTVDRNGNVVSTGWFTGTTDFDPGPGVYNLTSAGDHDCYVVKLDAAGQFVWAKRIGNSSRNEGEGVGTDAVGNVFFGGQFIGTVDFDPGPGVYTVASGSTIGFDNAFLVKLDANGDFVNMAHLSATRISALSSLYVDPMGGVILSGYFEGTMDYDPTPLMHNCTSVGLMEIFALRLDAGGNLAWTGQMGGATHDRPMGMEFDPLGKLYLTGVFSTTADFDMGNGTSMVTSFGSADVFVVSTEVCSPSNPTAVNVTTCGSYFWSATQELYTTSGTYYHQLANTDGCDSTITLNLVVNPSSSTSIIQTACSSFTLNSQTYTSSGTYTQTLVNSVGCDSVITLHLTITQPSTATITATACNSYTLNAQTYSSSGTYTQTLMNGVGCDSIITLQLILQTVDSTVAVSNNQITANQAGAQYQWLDCDNGMSPIAGATGQTYAPLVSGNFAVQVIVAPCTDTSACTPVIVVKVDPSIANHLRVYPNPSTGIYNLYSNFQNPVMKMYNALGQEVGKLTGTQIDLQEEPEGIYFLNVYSEEDRQVVLLVKKQQ